MGNSLTYFNLLGAVGSFRRTTRNNSLLWGQVFSNDLLTILITLQVITESKTTDITIVHNVHHTKWMTKSLPYNWLAQTLKVHLSVLFDNLLFFGKLRSFFTVFPLQSSYTQRDSTGDSEVNQEKITWVDSIACYILEPYLKHSILLIIHSIKS